LLFIHTLISFGETFRLEDSMSRNIKVVVLGGSGVVTPELVDVLVQEGQRPPLDLVLVGRTREKLEVVGRLCQRMAERATAELKVSFTTDIEAALDGADYVINQIRVGDLKARAFDESFPQEFGIPGEETVGPGGFANALRTVPVVLDYCRLVERLAPKALILNQTNPSSVIQYAITRYTQVSAIGLCNSPVDLIKGIAAVLDAPLEELSISYVGMHHFGWVTKVRWKGEDMMPVVLEKAGDRFGVDPEVIQAIGAIPCPYFRYFFHPDRMLAKQQGRKPRAEELLQMYAAMLEEYKGWASAEKPESLAKRGALWYKEIVVPVLLAIINDSREQFTVNVVNNSTIPFLPGEAIVEVPTIVGLNEIRPLTVDVEAIPPDVVAMLQLNCAYEMLMVEAIVERSYPKALRALLLSSLVSSADQAKGILDRIWPGP